MTLLTGAKFGRTTSSSLVPIPARYDPSRSAGNAARTGAAPVPALDSLSEFTAAYDRKLAAIKAVKEDSLVMTTFGSHKSAVPSMAHRFVEARPVARSPNAIRGGAGDSAAGAV